MMPHKKRHDIEENHRDGDMLYFRRWQRYRPGVPPGGGGVPVEKDDTDTFLAAKYGLRQGCRTFHIYGGTGGRLDHTLANLQLLVWLSQREARGYLYDAAFTYTAVTNGSITIPQGLAWGLLSVFCMGPEARGVCESGVQYPLEDAVLTADFPLGVSNHIIAPEARISVGEGTLVIGWER